MIMKLVEFFVLCVFPRGRVCVCGGWGGGGGGGGGGGVLIYDKSGMQTVLQILISTMHQLEL